MTPLQLPDLLSRATAVFLFTLGTGMVAVHATLVALAAHQSALDRRHRVLVPVLVAAFLSVWFGVAIAIGDRGEFSTRPRG